MYGLKYRLGINMKEEEYRKKYPNRCGKECEVYSRVVGYLRPVKQWNKGKQQEFKDRKVYK